MIYLASPYYHQERPIMDARAAAVSMAAAHLMKTGNQVYSPIAHGHAVQEFLPEELRGDHKFWLTHDYPFIMQSKHIVVLTLPGWQHSRGVRWEVETGRAFNLPVSLMYDQACEAFDRYDIEPLGKYPWEV